MKRLTLVALLVAVVTVSCTHKEQTPANGGATASEATPITSETNSAASGASAKQNLYVTFQFSDVAVTSSGLAVLRLGFDVKNGGTDPLLCEESGFSLQLADGSTLAPDAGAENRCDPDTIDPGSTGKGTMFFDLKNGYSGPVTLIMSDNDSVIGRGTTQVH